MTMQYRFATSVSNKIKNVLQIRRLTTKIPLTPVKTLENKQSDITKVDSNTIALLERLSLVKCDTDEGVKVLEDSIAFSDKVLHIDTTNVQPLYTVLENENLSLRNDKITQGNCQADILKNASVIEDDYLVAPQGNIPLHEVQSEQEIKNFTDKTILALNKPSRILYENIYKSWLKSINSKSNENFPVYIGKDISQKYKQSCYGYIEPNIPELHEITLQVEETELKPLTNIELKFNVISPRQDSMKHFIQWQRYRKYWWSSVTTTPSLFTINDMKIGVDGTSVNIIANFSWGQHTVETISVDNNLEVSDNPKGISHLTCTMGLETGLITLLMDGLTNRTDYLKLHNKLAPYKISFALDSEGMNGDPKIITTLTELSTLLYHKLNLRDISTWLPNFTKPLGSQIKENLEMGVTYTAILNESILVDGIFHLLNSSTMLKEQVHIADFDSYVALLCGKQQNTVKEN